jgi:hypothetical protein
MEVNYCINKVIASLREQITAHKSELEDLCEDVIVKIVKFIERK